MVISKKLKTLVENVLELHLKYLREKNVQDKIKIHKVEVDEDVLQILNRFNEENGTKLKQSTIKNGVHRIIRHVEKYFGTTSADSSELLVYDYFKVLYKQTDQIEKQSYFNELLNIYFQELQKNLPYFKEDKYCKLLKIFSAYIKFEILAEMSKKGTSPTKSFLGEIFECLLYPRLLRENCYQIVFNRIKSTKYEFKHFKCVPLVEGKGFLGEYLKVKMTIKRNNFEEAFDFFAKYLPTRNETVQKIALNAFKKENFVYKEFIPLLKKFGIKELANFAPKCFLSIKNDVIILEEMNSLGYKFSDIMVSRNYDWIVMVVKQLSRFHSCSMILDKKLSEQSGGETRVGDSFKDYLYEINFDKDTEDGQMMYFGARLISGYFVEKLSEICTGMTVEEFKVKAKIEAENAFENEKRSDRFYNVICHGDLWSGNILSNSQMGCVFVDYQMIKYCPPVVDLLFVIYMNSDRGVRLKYLKDFTEIYFNELKHNLNRYNVNIDDVFNQNEFHVTVDYFKSTAIVQALAYSQLMLIPRDVLHKLDSDEKTAKDFYFRDRREVHETAWNHQPFKTRITGLIEDLYEICASK